MANVQQLTTIEQWEQALKGSAAKPLLVFKHSTSCSVSAGAHEEFTHFIEDRKAEQVDYAIVHVIEDRPVSNAIAEQLDIKHASPQAILVKDGQPVWNTSHWHITYAFLSEKLVPSASNL
ncbi:bacillithiol system redox-active protein YtxJ [Cohnella endophytica]|uniref:Bacillithiol system redox-active protein YtxJ n=1 Tax=Cohnella endophytica TaxID=2419778 RepID=A0A494Y5Z0_9BACL|nr:bacillithiol system redox-active protein YtxJ [Cohnella endophytica]RKP55340.1 bacillithiol system redox-active protein YtxJ [Cohnella endophytica]